MITERAYLWMIVCSIVLNIATAIVLTVDRLGLTDQIHELGYFWLGAGAVLLLVANILRAIRP